MDTAFGKLVTLITLFLCHVYASPLKQSSPDKSPENNFNSTRITELIATKGNETIDDLVTKQTNTIKQIVSNHQSLLNYPTVTKYPPDDEKQEKTREDEKLTLEELKIKCQHLARLAAGTPGIKPAATAKPFANPFAVYNSFKLSKPSNIRPMGFYITTETPVRTTTTTTEKPSTTTSAKPSIAPSKPGENVKLIKLEPVILVKTILGDGRVIYNWHKSLPSAVQMAPIEPPAPSPIPAPTTTTEASSGYDFRYFFPSFYSSGNAQPVDSSSTEKTTTTATTTTEQLGYKQQLKFVIPVPYASPEDPVIKKPGDFDQFAYYPKPLQPETVNLEVPYVPTFHVINALMLPKKYQNNTLSQNGFTGFQNNY